MNFLNTAAEATAASAAALASSDGGNTMTITEALGLSVTGIAVVMIILALLAVLVVILSKIVRFFEKAARKKSDKNAAKSEIPQTKAALNAKPEVGKTVALDEKQSAGNLELYKTDEKTAAVIMAIVSKESGIALNKLQFNSIKLIEK